jgi:hypothetical protein
MYWFPKIKIGKISFWIDVSAFLLIFLPYWIAMLFHITFISLGILAMLCACVAGVTSVIAFTKHRDHAILLLVSAFIGAMALSFILGEFLFPH